VDKDLTAYSIDFARSGESEGAAAAETAARLSMRHVRRKIDSEDLEAEFESSVWHSETVVANTHGTAKMLLARRAKLDVKAVLTGEGADELHGGYAYFRHAALIAAAAEGQGQAALASFVARHGPRDGVLGGITPKLRRRLAWSNDGGTPYAAMRAAVAGRGTRLLTTADFQRQAPDKPEQVLLDWLSIRSPQARILDDATLSRFVALQTDLPSYNLGYLGDRVEMANGLEARLPFLDSRVADFLWRLPAEFHQRNGESKRILRALLARTLPTTALKPKRAFLTPSTQCRDLMGSQLSRRWLSRDATRRAGIFKPGALAAAQFLAAAASGNTSLAFYLSSYLTMAISAHLVIELFCERFQDNLARRSALSLDELRRRMGRDDRRLGATAA
jgi:asparagine synthase (glutamine-hydrolysing)